MTLVIVVVAGIAVGVGIELALSARARRRVPPIEPIEGTLLPPPAPTARPDRRVGRSARSDLVIGPDGSIEFVEPARPSDEADGWGTGDRGDPGAH